MSLIVDFVLLMLTVSAVLISLYMLVLTQLSGVVKTVSRPATRYLKFDVTVLTHRVQS